MKKKERILKSNFGNGVCAVLILLLGFFFTQPTQAQVSKLSKSERDSLAAIPYPYILPIFGGKIRERGIDFPHPFGIMANYIYQESKYDLENPQIGIGDSDLVSIDFVDFKTVKNRTNILNFRADAWLFPFLNVYGIYARSESRSNIEIGFPLNIEVEANPTGETWGFGTVVAYGLGNYFAAGNLNYSWTSISSLDDPVQGTVASLRFGRNFQLGKANRSFIPTIGIQYQRITQDSGGELPISNIFASFDEDDLNELKSQIADEAMNWYDELSLPQKLVVDRLVNALDNWLSGRDLGSTPLRYSFDKVPLGEWSFQVGFQYNHSKHWWYRLETGFGPGRFQLMTSINYRFGI
ncbi:hypothetical protein GCM10023115_33010 [Pontixanthobacter gangjinensis]|uniref:Uncharacterized protein n=1 Tax=Christiangramia aestuarii TaxID=1028746 RepID=A0A7K1LSH0_9FLAO|nr:hypothetical protein [Christiangramia aestuarii]MUP43717.1 hypothetical protein [Christiangramia aestuarii]